MKPEDHLLEVHKALHTISDRQELARIQDQLLSLNLLCAHWRETLDPDAAGHGLTAGHLAVTARERAAEKRKVIEGAEMDVFEFSFSVRTSDGTVTGAVCLTDPDIDAGQFVGSNIKPTKT